MITLGTNYANRGKNDILYKDQGTQKLCPILRHMPIWPIYGSTPHPRENLRREIEGAMCYIPLFEKLFNNSMLILL